MKRIDVKKKSSILTSARAAIAAGGAAAVSDRLFAIVVDRAREAIETPDGTALEDFTAELEIFYRELFSAAPEAAREASRGAGQGDEAAAFNLGQAAFAHLLAARTLDRRADARFLQTIRDRRYERYVRALQREPMTNGDLAEEVAEREETASRKLSVLRTLGIVSARKEGNAVVNRLSPAALAVLDHFKIAPLAARTAHSPDVQKALDAKNGRVSIRFRTLSPWGEPVPRRGRVKVAAGA